MFRKRFATLALVAMLAVSVPASSAPQAEDRMALSPARMELVVKPGEEKTVAVTVRYMSTSGASQPVRLRAALGDWSQSSAGELQFFPPNSQPNSACPWILYSPSEIATPPGGTQAIRVTVTVPADAAPGDHLAALFVEPRLGQLETATNEKKIQVAVRMAVLIYVMVPDLTRKLSLENLTARSDAAAITVTPTIHNDGNSHVRPLHSVAVLDRAGAVVAELPEHELCSVLARSDLSPSLRIAGDFAPGTYVVRYRMDARDGGSIVEGRTEVTIAPGHVAEAPRPSSN